MCETGGFNGADTARSIARASPQTALIQKSALNSRPAGRTTDADRALGQPKTAQSLAIDDPTGIQQLADRLIE
jgi:hypothetical protein